jgi:hypothetical protein
MFIKTLSNHHLKIFNVDILENNNHAIYIRFHGNLNSNHNLVEIVQKWISIGQNMSLEMNANIT